MQPAVLDALGNQRLRTMPNSFLPPTMQGLSSSPFTGVIMVGDAWNMRHPLTGGGMTVAFCDAVLLTEYLRPSETLPAGREGLEDWAKVSVGLREWFWRRKGVAGVVNVLSMALYDLFGGADGGSLPLFFLCLASRYSTRGEGEDTANLCLAVEPDLEILREGCFRYFELGGECVAGPVGLLSACVDANLDRSPLPAPRLVIRSTLLTCLTP